MAEKIRGRVYSVADGDSITIIRNDNKQKFTIRLNRIDANEHYQPGYLAAKRALERKILGSQIEATWYDDDRYGRHVCTIHKNGENICLWMVKEGHAIHYKQFSWGGQRQVYEQAQEKAAQQKKGRWGNPNDLARVMPDKWRHEFLENRNSEFAKALMRDPRFSAFNPPPSVKTAKQYADWLDRQVRERRPAVLRGLQAILKRNPKLVQQGEADFERQMTLVGRGISERGVSRRLVLDMDRIRLFPAEWRAAIARHALSFDIKQVGPFLQGAAIQTSGKEPRADTHVVDLKGIKVPARYANNRLLLSQYIMSQVRLASGTREQLKRFYGLTEKDWQRKEMKLRLAQLAAREQRNTFNIKRLVRTMFEMGPDAALVGGSQIFRDAMKMAYMELRRTGKLAHAPGEQRVPFTSSKWYGKRLKDLPIHALAQLADRPVENLEGHYFDKQVQKYLKLAPQKRRAVKEFFEVGDRMSPADLHRHQRGIKVPKYKYSFKVLETTGKWRTQSYWKYGYAEDREGFASERDLERRGSGFQQSLDVWPSQADYKPEMVSGAGYRHVTHWDESWFGLTGLYGWRVWDLMRTGRDFTERMAIPVAGYQWRRREQRHVKEWDPDYIASKLRHEFQKVTGVRARPEGEAGGAYKVGRLPDWWYRAMGSLRAMGVREKDLRRAEKAFKEAYGASVDKWQRLQMLSLQAESQWNRIFRVEQPREMIQREDMAWLNPEITTMPFISSDERMLDPRAREELAPGEPSYFERILKAETREQLRQVALELDERIGSMGPEGQVQGGKGMRPGTAASYNVGEGWEALELLDQGNLRKKWWERYNALAHTDRQL